MPKQLQYFLGVQKSFKSQAFAMLAQQAQMALPEGVSGLVICMRLHNQSAAFEDYLQNKSAGHLLRII